MFNSLILNENTFEKLKNSEFYEGNKFALKETHHSHTKVCVSECPTDNYSPWLESQVSSVLEGQARESMIDSLLEGEVKEKMRPFCTADTSDSIFSELSVTQLLDRDGAELENYYKKLSSSITNCLKNGNAEL